MSRSSWIDLCGPGLLRGELEQRLRLVMGGETRAENVAARREGERLPLPVGPDFALDKAIKNVVIAAAKTKRYRAEHAAAHSR